MKTCKPTRIVRTRWRAQTAFTLIEVAIATAVAALVLAGLFQGYNMAGRRAMYSACNLAANVQCMQLIEQVETAQWVPSTGTIQFVSLPSPWSSSYSNGLFTATETVATNLYLPQAQSNVVDCTNYVTVTQISNTPPYVMIKAQCVWSLPSYSATFTNNLGVLRGPNSP